jgi:hypothetical protein
MICETWMVLVERYVLAARRLADATRRHQGVAEAKAECFAARQALGQHRESHRCGRRPALAATAVA